MAAGFAYNAAENLVHFGDGTDNGEVSTVLELEVKWRPFVVNDILPRSPSPGAKVEPTCLLFVGVYGCHGIPHPQKSPEADLNNTYWAEVTCSPCLPNNNGGVDSMSKRTKAQKRPKPRDDSDIVDADASEEDTLKRNITLLVRNEVPNEVIAQVCSLSLEQVAHVMDRSSHAHVDLDIKWEDGFWFLLDDPRTPTVKVEVFKSSPNQDDESIGVFEYAVDQLLHCDGMSDWQKRHPLTVGDPDLLARPNITANFQLHAVFNGQWNSPRRRSALSPKPKVRSEPPDQTKVVFLDKTGRAMVQINGMWVDDQDVAKELQTEAEATSPTGLMDRAKGAVQAAAHGVQDMFARHHHSGAEHESPDNGAGVLLDTLPAQGQSNAQIATAGREEYVGEKALAAAASDIRERIQEQAAGAAEQAMAEHSRGKRPHKLLLKVGTMLQTCCSSGHLAPQQRRGAEASTTAPVHLSPPGAVKAGAVVLAAGPPTTTFRPASDGSVGLLQVAQPQRMQGWQLSYKPQPRVLPQGSGTASPAAALPAATAAAVGSQAPLVAAAQVRQPAQPRGL